MRQPWPSPSLVPLPCGAAGRLRGCTAHLTSRAVLDSRIDYLHVASGRGHNASAQAQRLPVDEDQPPQGEAAALEAKEPGLPLAVERRSLAAARDGHLDVGGALDLAAQLEVRAGSQEDSDVGAMILSFVDQESEIARCGDKAGQRRR